MNIKWNGKENERIILFFAGWGADRNSIAHLAGNGYDVALIYDYTYLTAEREIFSAERERVLTAILPQYSEVYLAAWSMGVWAATLFMDGMAVDIKQSVAICGTPLPIDDLYGIPQAVYNGTLDNLQKDLDNGASAASSRNMRKFNMRMCGGKEGFERYSERVPERTLPNVLNELRSIKENCYLCAPFRWSSAIIGESDLIFPAQNQKRYWEENIDRKSIHCIDSPHYPFFSFSGWDAIFKMHIK